MDTQEQIADSKIAAEDIIRSLELMLDRAGQALIQKPAREIHAQSPELFEVQAAIAKVARSAIDGKAALLQVIGMKPGTQLSQPLSSW